MKKNILMVLSLLSVGIMSASSEKEMVSHFNVLVDDLSKKIPGQPAYFCLPTPMSLIRLSPQIVTMFEKNKWSLLYIKKLLPLGELQTIESSAQKESNQIEKETRAALSALELSNESPLSKESKRAEILKNKNRSIDSLGSAYDIFCCQLPCIDYYMYADHNNTTLDLQQRHKRLNISKKLFQYLMDAQVGYCPLARREFAMLVQERYPYFFDTLLLYKHLTFAGDQFRPAQKKIEYEEVRDLWEANITDLAMRIQELKRIYSQSLTQDLLQDAIKEMVLKRFVDIANVSEKFSMGELCAIGNQFFINEFRNKCFAITGFSQENKGDCAFIERLIKILSAEK